MKSGVLFCTLSALSAASRLVASVCSLCWAMFLSAARLRRVIACFRFTAEWLSESTVAGASSSQAFRISTAVMPITQRSNAPENTDKTFDKGKPGQTSDKELEPSQKNLSCQSVFSLILKNVDKKKKKKFAKFDRQGEIASRHTAIQCLLIKFIDHIPTPQWINHFHVYFSSSTLILKIVGYHGKNKHLLKHIVNRTKKNT